jgi:hypothetical protein
MAIVDRVAHRQRAEPGGHVLHRGNGPRLVLNPCLDGASGGGSDPIERLWGPVSLPKEEVAAADRH